MSGWANGKLEVRAYMMHTYDAKTLLGVAFDDGCWEPEGNVLVPSQVRGDRQGEVMFRDTFTDAVSAVLQADYRSDGREELIACGYDGEVRALLLFICPHKRV